MRHQLLGAVLAVAALCGASCATANQLLPAEGTVEVAFTPAGQPEALLVRVIGQARSSIEVQAYAFTSRPIAAALIAAHRRGVRVQVLADERMNRRGTGNVLPDLVAAGIPVAFETRYAAAHNKVLIADAAGPACTLATGSFNFTRAASTRNAENLIVLRDNCPLVQAYLENWQRHREDASPVAADYWTFER
ncbi:MAG TPA: phospholipase D family protein [Aromatoleum sp.]|uniref:phospholipase D family nuclease n=1 Tax=Aromatoleum sp. TaxID=2307007 RepID=UPI002B48E2B4|nr:phospholipase D family protein [Aromatoleum sp.]HJV25226.1 phospholipase D family protein [Aromatoleum sp.]